MFAYWQFLGPLLGRCSVSQEGCPGWINRKLLGFSPQMQLQEKQRSTGDGFWDRTAGMGRRGSLTSEIINGLRIGSWHWNQGLVLNFGKHSSISGISFWLWLMWVQLAMLWLSFFSRLYFHLQEKQEHLVLFITEMGGKKIPIGYWPWFSWKKSIGFWLLAFQLKRRAKAAVWLTSP